VADESGRNIACSRVLADMKAVSAARSSLASDAAQVFPTNRFMRDEGGRRVVYACDREIGRYEVRAT
jgi:hypothetical protein